MKYGFYYVFKYALGHFIARYMHFEKFGFLGKNTHLGFPSDIVGSKNIYIEDNVIIQHDNVLYATNAKIIIKKNSGAAVGVTIVTGNHMGEVGKWCLLRGNNNLDDKDIVIEEDVWIASHVTILSGAHIGRGSVIGAGAVVRSVVPPYAMVVGNPAKVVGFKFSPEEAVQHEKALYPEGERLPKALLEKNYEKYFLKRIKEIKEWTRL